MIDNNQKPQHASTSAVSNRNSNKLDEPIKTLNNTSVVVESWQLLKLALPIIVALLSQVALGFFDIIMLGRYDELHFAAGALGATLILFFNLSAVGLMLGMSPLIAHAIGAGKPEQVRVIFQQGFWLSILVGLCLGLLTYFSGAVLQWLKLEASLSLLTNNYIHIMAWAMPFTTIYLVPRFVSEAIEYSAPMMVVQLIMIPVNILANYALIFGNLGFPELGVTGAAIGSLGTNILGFVLIWGYIYFSRFYKQYNLFANFSAPDPLVIKSILVLSVPIALTMIFEHSLFTMTILLMGKFGATAVASHEIAINYAATMFMIPLGLSMAITVKVSNAMGRGDIDYAKFRAKIGIVMAVGFMIISAIIIYFFHDVIGRIYTSYENILELAAKLLILAGIFQIVDGLQVSVVGVLRGLKDTKIPMILTFISYWLIGFPASILFAFYWGKNEQGLWYGLIFGLGVAAVLLSIRMFYVFRSFDKPVIK